MELLSEKYLAIEEGFLANYARVYSGANLTFSAEKPAVTHLAANSYGQLELSWLGIDSVNVDGKLLAIIPVDGVLTKGWGWGGTSTSWVSEQIKIAVDSENVAGIMLDINSPGGAVNGMNDFAQAIAQADKLKPVVSFVGFQCCSAALTAASQSKEIWIGSGKTTGVGSIGVMGTYTSIYEKNQKEGVDVRVLRSKGSEDKALLNIFEPIDEKALDEEQKIIDLMREEMLATIRDKRPQISESITGKVFYGKEAIKAGVADYVGGRDAALKRLLYLSTNK